MISPDRGIAWFFALTSSILFCLTSVSNPAHSKASPAALCTSAAAKASNFSGVPFDVMMAVSLTETGRKRQGKLQAWPWTVNMEGAGKWFDTQGDAQSFIEGHFKRGARSFDVGCFQINYKWHGHAFKSVEQMFDPDENAAYAARFLTDLFKEFGDWERAAGAFHSRTPKFAAKYRARFKRIRESLSPNAQTVLAESSQTVEAPIKPENRFPLLTLRGQQQSVGSLVRLENVPQIGRVVLLERADPISLAQ